MAGASKKPELDDHGFPATISTKALVSVTGITERRLDQLISDMRIPAECKSGPGRWHTAQALSEIFGYYRRQADRAKPKADLDVERQIELEDLRSKKLRNAKMARELLPRHVYVQTWGELLTVFKNRWINFAAKMGPRAFRAKDKVEAAEILDAEILDIFAGLADPKIMDDIEARIRDDDFNEQRPADGTAAGAPAGAGDLVPQDA